MTERFIAVFNALDEPTADIVKAALDDAGVPAVIQRNESCWFDGIFVNGEGVWGRVLVSAADADKAKQILEEYATQG